MIYDVQLAVDDEPAWWQCNVLVMAADRKDAIALAKAAARNAYFAQAGGYGTSGAKVILLSAKQAVLPRERGVIMVSGGFDR